MKVRITVFPIVWLGLVCEKAPRLIQYIDTVNLSMPQIRSSVMKLPSLLHYSVENNLRPKVQYLTSNLGISQADFTDMVIKNPALLGVSLEQRIVSMIDGLKCDCGMSDREVRQTFVQVPQLLSLNWETNVRQKIQYLKQRLDLSSRSAFRSMILSTPRILMHSVDRSLEPKIQKLEEASSSTKVQGGVQVWIPFLSTAMLSTFPY